MPEPPDVKLPARRVADQESVNACFSCALATCLEAEDVRVPPLSALYHFHQIARQWPDAVARGVSNETSAYLLLQAHGICTASLHAHPITPTSVLLRPTTEADADARARIPPIDARGEVRWRQVFSAPSREVRWKDLLGRGKPVLAVIWTNASYWRLGNHGADSWLSPFKEPSSTLHAVAILGTSAARQAFVVQDSRGPSFGAGGQWYLRYRDADSSAIDRAFVLEYPD